jgi:type I restriction enzyme S subunit
MKPDGIDIKPGEWEIVHGILDRHVPGREVWAFGSRAGGTAKAFSDLDLAILGNHPLDLSTLAELTDDFSESNLPFKVDIVDWATTSERFRRVIEADRIVLQQPARTEEPSR